MEAMDLADPPPLIKDKSSIFYGLTLRITIRSPISLVASSSRFVNQFRYQSWQQVNSHNE